MVERRLVAVFAACTVWLLAPAGCAADAGESLSASAVDIKAIRARDFLAFDPN